MVMVITTPIFIIAIIAIIVVTVMVAMVLPLGAVLTMMMVSPVVAVPLTMLHPLLLVSMF